MDWSGITAAANENPESFLRDDEGIFDVISAVFLNLGEVLDELYRSVTIGADFPQEEVDSLRTVLGRTHGLARLMEGACYERYGIE